jgi:hypothetical protein
MLVKLRLNNLIGGFCGVGESEKRCIYSPPVFRVQLFNVIPPLYCCQFFTQNQLLSILYVYGNIVSDLTAP